MGRKILIYVGLKNGDCQFYVVCNVAHVVESDKNHKALSSNHVLPNFSTFCFQNKMGGKEEVFEQTPFRVQAGSLVDFKAVVKVLNYRIPVSKCLMYFNL